MVSVFIVRCYRNFDSYFSNHSSCVIPHPEEHLSVSVCKILQSKIKTRLTLGEENTWKQK